MIELRVNSIDRTFDGDPEMPLLWYLRDTLGLTGTKFGCGIALCGACTVHKNGEALRACVTPMSSLAGTEIRTIEDVGDRGLHPVRKNMDATQHPAVRLLPVRTNHASHCVG
jgi:isoquinoline 1-oxidoreductase alpha subunit